MNDTVELEQVVEVRGVGRGWIGTFLADGEYAHIEFPDAPAVTVPRDHLGSSHYRLLDEVWADNAPADTA